MTSECSRTCWRYARTGSPCRTQDHLMNELQSADDLMHIQGEFRHLQTSMDHMINERATVSWWRHVHTRRIQTHLNCPHKQNLQTQCISKLHLQTRPSNTPPKCTSNPLSSYDDRATVSWWSHVQGDSKHFLLYLHLTQFSSRKKIFVLVKLCR